MTSTKEILVFGSINQDFFNYVEHFPQSGESVQSQSFQIGHGGKGANQAIMAAKLGANVTMIGMIGDDMFADFVFDNFKQVGVRTEFIQKVPNTNTGCAIITVDKNGENIIIVTPGANDHLKGEHVHELETQFAKVSLLMCQAEVPQEANLEAFRSAKKHNVTTFFNPAPASFDINREILSLTDIICTNETEASIITKMELKSLDDFKEAAHQLLNVGPMLAIITIGKQGAVVAQRLHGVPEVQIDVVEASKVKAEDTTGAGDCFCGAFAYFFINHPEIDKLEIVRRAVKVASISVTRSGCQSSYPTRDEVKEAGII